MNIADIESTWKYHIYQTRNVNLVNTLTNKGDNAV